MLDSTQPKDSEPFGWSYFDDPEGDGYRGYGKHGNGDDNYQPWWSAREFCVAHNVKSANDWGCAKGYVVEELLAAGIDAVGYDVSEYGVKLAKERGLPCEVKDLREPGRPVEATLVLGCLIYIEEHELAATLAHLRQATSRYLLFSNYYEGVPQDIPDPLRRITRPKSWWQEQLELAGFKFEREDKDFDVYVVA